MSATSPRSRRSTLRVLAAFVAMGLLWNVFAPSPVSAHNLQTRMVYMFLDPSAQACLDARIAGGSLPAGCAPLPGGWMPGDPILQAGD